MKMFKYFSILIAFAAFLQGCENFIDVNPESNESVDNFYKDYNQVSAALTGCYNGLQKPMNFEWMLTELRTDNAKQQTPSSTSAANIELNDLNMYVQSPSHAQIYNYWYAVYQNIKNINLVLNALDANYNDGTGATELGSASIAMDETKRKQLAGEAMFLRAYHYFNMVRLFGGVMIMTEPLAPADVKQINRSSVEEVYKLVKADLNAAIAGLSTKKYSEIAAADKGRVTAWAAKALLAKVHLTLGDKASALTLLNDIKTNSGYSLLTNFADVFSITNEMNAEILFAIRYKAGGFGIGSPFANRFAPLQSGSAVINGDGNGLNYPTNNIDAALITTDKRKVSTISKWTSKFYVTKFYSQVMNKEDAENDFPVIRYADVLLMLAEAEGYPNGIQYINQIKTRAGLPAVTAGVNDQALFEAELLKERRLEFAYENQRFFDLVRLNALIPVVKAYYASEYSAHYAKYPKPVATLAELQARLTPEKQLLPIPQREIDTNNEIDILQNLGY